ncbi:aminotransferase [Microbacterium lacus]|uniref:aminotransferase n=1 Tax=Microbacterium lacus TaxID=415217 RepID=UPI00384F9B4F
MDDVAPVVQPAPPEIDDATARRIAKDGWGVDAAPRSLGSHQDRNFLFDLGGESGDEKRLLKVANPSVSAAELEAQSAAAELIAASGTRVPLALPLAEGADRSTALRVEVEGTVMYARLMEFLAGETLSGYLSPTAIRAIGALAGRVDSALADFSSPAAERVHQWDLRHARRTLEELLPHVADDQLRSQLEAECTRAWAVVEPLAADLPMQFIHGDLTDDNVISTDGRVPDGVIDLGDLNLTWTVGEIAITVSSLLHHDGVGLAEAMVAVTAYDAARPLTDAEVEALWPLVIVRAATLVASAHHVLGIDPDNAYAAENLTHEEAILNGAISVPLAVATALVRRATSRAAEGIAAPSGLPLLGDATDVGVVDFSPTSAALSNDTWLAEDAERRIFGVALAQHPIVIAPFDQSRLTRSQPLHTAEPANVALGIELHTRDRMPLHAPWAGEVISHTSSSVTLRSGEFDLRIDGVVEPVAQETEATVGEVFAHLLGPAWIALGRTGLEIPRFVPRSLASAWHAVAADPSSLFGVEPSAAGADAARLLARRDAVFAEVQEHYFAEPPVIVRGWREYLIDADGRVTLDTLNNVASIGHGHPRIAAAVAEQWSLLNTNSRFHYPAVVEFAERLATLVPDPLDTVFLVNSGSEAVDLALRLAQAWSSRLDVVAMREAYHGWTYLSDAVSTSTADNPDALATRPEWIHTVDAPNTFRGAYGLDEAHRFAEDAVAEIDRLAADGTPPSAFLSETFYGNAGGMKLPDGYLGAVYAAVRAHGGLAIADEVQVGYGRLGDWFWGFQQQDATPDVVTIAKAMGAGHPLGAVITTREIAEAYRRGGYFFSSAGGSPVSSVVGLTVLDIIRDERLQENARDVGRYLKERIESLGQKHPLLAAVHGAGLYLGSEFVRDRDTWQPATAETAAICDRLLSLGVIAQPTGDHQNILKIKPPMCFSRKSADFLVDALDQVLTTGW